MCLVPCALCLVPCALCLVPCALCLVPCALCLNLSLSLNLNFNLSLNLPLLFSRKTDFGRFSLRLRGLELEELLPFKIECGCDQG